jgi:protocatechuate 3,4-dioxygenase beta subunit
VAGSPIPSCVVRPELTEGPYFVDVLLDRSDIRSDPGGAATRDGLPLELALAVSRIEGGACVPFEGALVDVWQCDAAGLYSGVSDRFGDTTGQSWLRGYQVTGADGVARFTTVYPGWYQGRTVHIHFKIRTDAAADQGLEFTSQLFFDDAVSDEVFAFEPYVGTGERGTRNTNDGIFGQSGGQLTLALARQPADGLRDDVRDRRRGRLTGYRVVRPRLRRRQAAAVPSSGCGCAVDDRAFDVREERGQEAERAPRLPTVQVRADQPHAAVAGDRDGRRAARADRGVVLSELDALKRGGGVEHGTGLRDRCTRR